MDKLLKESARAVTLPLAFQVLLEAGRAHGATRDPRWKEVAFYKKTGSGDIQCMTCPNQCLLSHKETGICRSRFNHKGVHYNRAYANPCILSVDPMEKLPLNNFLPGTDTVCIAVGGCNLRCKYCQNWEWSQKKPDAIRDTFDLGPAEAVHAALKKESSTLAFTYTDPVAFLEYLWDIADIAKDFGVKCVAATNGSLNKPAVRRTAEKLDAVTVGLKGFDDAFYEEICGARLEPVLKAIEEFQASGECWLELTTLIIPTYNDDRKEIKAMARWVRKNLGTRVPWHFSRFVPHYKFKNVPRTPVQTLDDAMKIALDEGLEYVYTSNIAPHKGNNTSCPRCGEVLIERIGFKILENRIKNGKCRCGHKIAGIFGTTRRA
jgi:pyruvate formate lyase activating enzyme